MNTMHCPNCGGTLTVSAGDSYCARCAGRLLLNLEPSEDLPNLEPNAPPALRMGEYELGAELGRGAMGAVYRARQPRLRRDVAIKVILASRFAGETARKRFLAEAELAAQLDHPNIVPIYEVGETADGPFYAMKLIEGGTLQERIDSLAYGPADSRLSAKLVSRIARAVDHAHQRGVLHRDLKPGNILIDVHGEPHITDFGLARQIAGESSLTLSGSSLGTPAYMSPEQARAEKSVTTASDVWSLGAILYHLLTGRPPFEGRSAVEVLQKVSTQEPTPPSRLAPRASVNSDIETICLKCLEKDPARRYASARALAEDLDRSLKHEPILARPGTSGERILKWTRRHPLRAGFVALGVVASLLVIGLALLYETRLRQNRDELSATLLRQDWQRAEELLTRGQSAEGVAVLARMLRNQPDSRAVAERLISALAEGNFTVRAGPAFNPGGHLGCAFAAFSRDGTRIITASEFGVNHWNARTGEKLAGPDSPAQGTDGNAECRLSPDGRTLLIRLPDFAPTNIQVWDVPGARRLAEWNVRSGALVTNATFSPEGHRVHIPGTTGDQERDVLLGRPPLPESPGLCARVESESTRESVDGWRIGPRAQTLTLSNAVSGKTWSGAARHFLEIRPCVLSPDGRQLFTGAKDRIAQLWDMKLARRGPVPLRHGTTHVRALFSPDGGTVLTTSDGSGMVFWDAATGQRRFALKHGENIYDANFDPTGRWLVSAGDDYSARVWDVQTGREKTPALRHDYPDYQPKDEIIYDSRFVLDGTRILTSGHGGDIRLWDADTHRLIASRLDRTSAWHYAEMNRDGTRLVALAPRAAWLRDARTFADIAQLTTNRHWVSAAEFSPNDRVLFVGSSTSAALFDPATGRPLGISFPHESAVSMARFSPDGRWLATSTEAGVARIWDVASGQPVSARMIHSGPVFTVNFSPDGLRLATACADGTARVWEARTGLPLCGPMAHPGKPRSARFSPDGRWVVTSCGDGVARLWEQPVLRGPAPLWLADLAEAMAGFRYDATGSIELIFAPALDLVRQRIRASPPEDPCARWATWILDNDDRKPVSPSAGLYTTGPAR